MTSETPPPATAAGPTPEIRITLPKGIPGVNEFATPQWWQDRLVELQAMAGRRGETESAEGPATVLTVVGSNSPGTGQATSCTAVLMIVTPIRDRIVHGQEHVGVDALVTAIQRSARGIVTWAARPPALLVVADEQPSDLRSLVGMVTRSGGASERVGGRPEPVPTGGLIGRFQHGLREQLEPDRSSAGDAVRQLAAGYAVAGLAMVVGAGRPAEQADRIRAAAEDALDDLVRAGIIIRGPRTGLLGPVPDAAVLPVDTAAEVSMAVLHGFLDRADSTAGTPAADLERAEHEVAELQQRLAARRAELARLRRDPHNLAQIGAGSLVRLLVGRNRG